MLKFEVTSKDDLKFKTDHPGKESFEQRIKPSAARCLVVTIDGSYYEKSTFY